MGKKQTVKKSEEEEITISMPNLRLVKLIVKNYKCIGSEGVDIDLNDIVVLVGPNNAGKSSILQAYQKVMQDGSKDSVLTIFDFPEEKIDPDNLPQVEVHSIVQDVRVGKHWLYQTETGEYLVKERWTWELPHKLPTRQGFNFEKKTWDEKAPFGFANVANLRRPEPHAVFAFQNPDDQANQVMGILMTAINQKVENLKASQDEENLYRSLLDQISTLQSELIDQSQEEIATINTELSRLISEVFPNYVIDFSISTEKDIEKSLTLFKSVEKELLMGPKGGYLSTVSRQGSGARRTLLWTALRYISESSRPVSDDGKPVRPHLLLIDEPEICLHPNAIRDASNVLYNLPQESNWQVMVTTHSPIFINLEKDNTTIIRVERGDKGKVKGTTIFRPDKAKLGKDDIENLKLLNLCDPYVAEFFFGGKVIIVEGDTEYTAFNYLKNLNPEKYFNIHVIRARGKATIVSLIKILNQFGTDYSILHDSDQPFTVLGKGNPAWGNNPNILSEIKKRPAGVNIRLLASLPNFEKAYFHEEIKRDKPYNALTTIRDNEDKKQIIEKLFDALIDHNAELPSNCTEWNDIDKLQEALVAVIVLNEQKS